MKKQHAEIVGEEASLLLDLDIAAHATKVLMTGKKRHMVIERKQIL